MQTEVAMLITHCVNIVCFTVVNHWSEIYIYRCTLKFNVTDLFDIPRNIEENIDLCYVQFLQTDADDFYPLWWDSLSPDLRHHGMVLGLGDRKIFNRWFPVIAFTYLFIWEEGIIKKLNQPHIFYVVVNIHANKINVVLTFCLKSGINITATTAKNLNKEIANTGGKGVTMICRFDISSPRQICSPNWYLQYVISYNA